MARRATPGTARPGHHHHHLAADGTGLEFDEQGRLFALSRGSLFEVDPVTLMARRLMSGLTDYTLASDGQALYYTKSDELFRLSPDS